MKQRGGSMTTEKTPDELQPGDIVTPTRGMLMGVRCKVKAVTKGKYATYRVLVVPVEPRTAEWSVDFAEKVKIESIR